MWGQASTDHWVEPRSWHPQMRGEERQQHFTRGFFSSGQKSLWLWHCLSSIHCQEAIMSGLCNVCDYLSNCHGIVCQFLLFNRETGRQANRERGRETQMFIWRRYLNVRNKIRHGHNGKVTQTEWLECCGCLGDAIKAQLLFSPNLSSSAQTQVSQDYVESSLCLAHRRGGWRWVAATQVRTL